MTSHKARVLLMSFAAASVGTLVPVSTAHAGGDRCQGVAATIVGTKGDDTIQGTSGRDVIVARGGNDTIHGGRGADVICGGRGADHIDGGSGADKLFGGRDRLHTAQEDGTERIGDTISGGPGSDRIHLGADDRSAASVAVDTVSWDDAARGVTIDLAGARAVGEGHDRFSGGTFAVVGSSFSDVVNGSNGRDRIYTGPGSDVVRAHGGADVVVVDDVQDGRGGYGDRVHGGRGADRISASRGQDRLFGGPGADEIEDMGRSNDVLRGSAGDDVLVGEIGDTDNPQRFDGGGGLDTLDLYSDRINRNQSRSAGKWNMTTGEMTYTLDHDIQLTAARIEHVVFGTWGTAWTVTGTDGADNVGATGTSATTFDGLAGDDTFRGSDGDDVFNGGDGADRVQQMGDGDDTCTSVETFETDDCEHVS